MKVTRLRLHGFKSFVETADVPIEPGLTGIVGPNGCGKSNLVEAVRFVMGESSYKALRGGGMNDVIFAGSSARPARDIAEVTLIADAEGAVGADATLEITRRIERDAGSAYRINGREVRARDVQLLFADAATGPRSSALVRQGQIGELIAARPQQRRGILEDAAGISGLHSRRGEAESKLKAAEANLERLDDVQNELGLQLEGLRRQARQAVRYRTLSADIRRAEALVHLLEWDSAVQRLQHAEAELARAGNALADAGGKQAQAARDEAVAAQVLPALRDAAATAGAALQRLRLFGEEIEREQSRLRARGAELAARRVQIAADLAHEGDIGTDAAEALGRIEDEQAHLAEARIAYGERLRHARRRAEEAGAASARSEAAFAEAAAALAAAAAERAARERAVADGGTRLARLAAERQTALQERDTLEAERRRDVAASDTAARLAEAERAYAERDAEAQAAEAALAAAREAERRARLPVEAAEKSLAGLQAEGRTLAHVLDLGKGKRFAPVMDAVEVTPGYEQALVAALGEDLDVALDPAAPAHWGASGPADNDVALPYGAEPLTSYVRGPDELSRRLAQVGVVDDVAGPALAAGLAAGQRLVSRSGALWRWDGLCVRAGASTAAARRLEQRNRVAALVKEMKVARAGVQKAADLYATGKAIRVDAERFEAESREALREARRGLDTLRAALSDAERRAGRFGDRIAALTGALERLDAAAAAARAELAASEKAVAALADTSVLAGKREALQRRLEKDRVAAAEARLGSETSAHEEQVRARRFDELDAERERWQARVERARSRIAELTGRLSGVDAELTAAAGQPEKLAERQRGLLGEIVAAETASAEAADRLARAEAAARDAAGRARAALEVLSLAREEQARDGERVIAAGSRREELDRRIRELFGKPPHALRALAGLAADAAMPDAAALQGRLDRLKAERDRLGAVNLRAEDEATELDARLSAMRREREDLEGAIRSLREGIQTLNREGRERLLAAFEVVNGHFRSLFRHLFGGGNAELTLTDSADALEAGLDIIARPPGKRAQTMTLLSGGEQTLTALSLIFAVFLTNPSPICVLDEVDAPLDDANVERFCNLVDEMRRRTETRFLVVTHNPITMARMDRLFGVTMAERGVSQLVSVDLQTAERFREAS